MLMSEGGIARSHQTCMQQTQKGFLYDSEAVLHICLRSLTSMPGITALPRSAMMTCELQARVAFHKRWNVDAPPTQPDASSAWTWCLEHRRSLAQTPAGTKHPRNIFELPGPL